MTHQLVFLPLAGAFCLFIYDSILTFPMEYRYIWKAGPSWGKVRENHRMSPTYNESSSLKIEALLYLTLWRFDSRYRYDPP